MNNELAIIVNVPTIILCRESPRRQIIAGSNGPKINPNQEKFAMASSNQVVVIPQPKVRGGIKNNADVK